MPQIRFHLIKKKDVAKFIGKAKINDFVFYLIKWKDELQKQISWQHTSVMGNMGKFLKSYNHSVKGKMLPCIEQDYLDEGLQLLERVDVQKEREKYMWKIEQIIGKRQLNGYVYYFMKWKHVSIFESDWIAQHGLWRLYPEELKSCKARLLNQSLPFTDRQSLNSYIEAERLAFQKDQQPIVDIYENSRKIKREKLQPKGIKQEEIRMKKEFSKMEKEDILEELIKELRERFFHPAQELYLKDQYPVKHQKLQFDETHQLYTNEMTPWKDLKQETQISFETRKNISKKDKNKMKQESKTRKLRQNTIFKQEVTKIKGSDLIQQAQNEHQLSSSVEQAIIRLSPYLIKLQPQQVNQDENISKSNAEKAPDTIIERIDRKIDRQEKIQPQSIQQQKSLKTDKHKLKNKLKKEQQSKSFSQQVSNPQQVIEISLFSQNIPKIISSSSKTSQPQTQNLYQVILKRQKKKIDLSQDDTLNESSEVQVSQNFYMTSFVAQHYPKQLINYLEKENAKLRKIIKQGGRKH